MVSIKVREDEPFEKALRRFKKKWEKAGILRDVRGNSLNEASGEEYHTAHPFSRRQMNKVLKIQTSVWIFFFTPFLSCPNSQ